MDVRTDHVSPKPHRVRIWVDGTNPGAFDRGDWLIAVTVATLWGSSFLWIAFALDSFGPGVIAFGRVALGAAALWLLPAARRPVPRTLWPTITIVAIAGNAAPALLFALGQLTVSSSVAGMINSATPIAVLAVGAVLSGRLPERNQTTGIGIGLLGVTAISWPSLAGGDSGPSGVALLMLGVLGYGIANNMVVAPQQQVGAVPVMARALTMASVALVPLAITGVGNSTFTIGSFTAVLILGVCGTGIARALNTTLAGRTGAARGSITTYLVPFVAITLGTTFRDESLQALQIAGTVIVLTGAWLTTRRASELPHQEWHDSAV